MVTSSIFLEKIEQTIPVKEDLTRADYFKVVTASCQYASTAVFAIFEAITLCFIFPFVFYSPDASDKQKLLSFQRLEESGLNILRAISAAAQTGLKATKLAFSCSG